MIKDIKIGKKFTLSDRVVVYPGDYLDLLKSVPNGKIQLIVTSPPYNIGKEYVKRLNLSRYLDQQAAIIAECARTLSDRGSICWQVGNYVDKGKIVPLDTVLYPIFRNFWLKLRNRILGYFEHGLQCA